MNNAEPHYYTLGQAAKATGKSKSTLLEAIGKGRFSVFDRVGNRYRIDPAELHRVYPPAELAISEEKNNADPMLEQLKIKNAQQDAELLALRTRLTDKEEQVTDLQKDRDHWRQQATYLLEDKRQQEQPTQRKGLLASLFGK
jgi:excisionase family DNA binding protein